MLFLLNFFRVFFYLLILKLKNKNLTFIGWMYHGNLISTLFSAMCFSRNNIWSIRATLDALADEKFFLRLITFNHYNDKFSNL